MFHIIVLAAGLSRRMGADNKLLLPWGHKTVLEMTIDNILAAQIGHLNIVVGHEAEDIKKALKHYSNQTSPPPPQYSQQFRLRTGYDDLYSSRNKKYF